MLGGETHRRKQPESDHELSLLPPFCGHGHELPTTAAFRGQGTGGFLMPGCTLKPMRGPRRTCGQQCPLGACPLGAPHPQSPFRSSA